MDRFTRSRFINKIGDMIDMAETLGRLAEKHGEIELAKMMGNINNGLIEVGMSADKAEDEG